MNISSVFLFFWHVLEIIDIFAYGKKQKTVGFFSNNMKVKSFKLCMIITLLRFHTVLPGLLVLTLSQGHRFV